MSKGKGCGESIGDGEARGASMNGHDLSQRHHHGTVVAAIEEGEPELDCEQPHEGGCVHQPGERGEENQ